MTTNYREAGQGYRSAIPYEGVVAGVTPPTVVTGSASGISPTSAIAGGMVNDNGGTTTVTMQYGFTTDYGLSASGGTVTGGAGNTAVTATLNGLASGVLYHFRVIASNSAGTTLGLDATFTTDMRVGAIPRRRGRHRDLYWN